MGKQVPGTRFIAFKVPLKEVNSRIVNDIACLLLSFVPFVAIDSKPTLRCRQSIGELRAFSVLLLSLSIKTICLQASPLNNIKTTRLFIPP